MSNSNEEIMSSSNEEIMREDVFPEIYEGPEGETEIYSESIYYTESLSSDHTTDILQEIPVDVLEKFKKDLKEDFPNAIHIYSFLHTLMVWKKKKPEVDTLILSPNGDPSQGIVLCVLTHNSFNGTIYAKDDYSVGKLKEALEISKRLPFRTKEVTLFTCMTGTSFKALEKIASGPDWCVNHDTVHWLPWYAAREMEIHIPNDDVEVRDLGAEHAEQINSIWPHKFDGSEDLIKDMIDVNFGLGVFRGDKLLSWVILWFYGGLGVLQTLETEKRKGYARAVVEAMTKRLGELQFDVHLNVVHGNDGANNFFKALGFRYAFPSVWASRGLYRERATELPIRSSQSSI